MAIEEAPELPGFQRCTKLTTMHGAILFQRNPEISWVTPTLWVIKKIPRPKWGWSSGTVPYSQREFLTFRFSYKSENEGFGSHI